MNRRLLKTLLLLVAVLLPATAARAQEPPVAPAPTPEPPALTASLDPDRQRPTVVVRFGTRATLRVRLLDGDGKPLAGATLRVTSRPLVTGADEVSAGTLTTDEDGAFSKRLPAGPSRRLTLSYRRSPDDATPAAMAKATLLVRAGVHLSASPTSLRNGQTLRLRGELRGRPLPAAGKFVDLQVRRGGKWLTFASIRARGGRFAYAYRFRNTVRKRTLTFRVQVPAFSTYPYVRGVSRTARVTVRPRPRRG